MKLTGLEKRWAHVAFDVIYPGHEEAGLVGMRSIDTSSFLDELYAYIPFQAGLGLRVAIWIATFAPLFVIARFAMLATLAREEREKVLYRLMASKSYAIRSLVLILKTMGAMVYAGDAAVRARMHAVARQDAKPAPSTEPLVPLRLKRPAAA